MHENTEQKENKDIVSRWLSHTNHRITYKRLNFNQHTFLNSLINALLSADYHNAVYQQGGSGRSVIQSNVLAPQRDFNLMLQPSMLKLGHHILKFSFTKEGTTEKVSQFIVPPMNSIINKSTRINEQKCIF